MKTETNNKNNQTYAMPGKSNLAGKSLVSITMLALAVAAFSLASSQSRAGEKPPKPPKPGKGIVHYFAQEDMLNQGVLADATGRVSIHEDGQSKGKAEDVHIDLHHLEANATYDITATTGGDTNSVVEVGQITSDPHGNAVIDLRDKGGGKAPGGKGKLPLPAELQPVSAIQQISIQDSNAAMVLTADLNAPNKFEYFVKADLSGSGIKGSMDLKANLHKGQIKASASGLEAGAEYSLSLNGNPVTTATTDAKGKLQIGWELQNPADAMSIQAVDLLDSTGTTAASASLP